jgi:hypothetical protein
MLGLYRDSSQVSRCKKQNSLRLVMFCFFGCSFLLYVYNAQADEEIHLPESIANQWKQYVESSRKLQMRETTKYYDVKTGHKELTSDDTSVFGLGDGFGLLYWKYIEFDGDKREERGGVSAFNKTTRLA